jgi:hypothetical protein
MAASLQGAKEHPLLEAITKQRSEEWDNFTYLTLSLARRTNLKWHGNSVLLLIVITLDRLPLRRIVFNVFLIYFATPSVL